MLKKLIQFLKTKLNAFFNKNVSVEERYAEAANSIIDEITKLRIAREKSINEEKRVLAVAKEKREKAESRENTIREMIKNGDNNVQTHVKLGLLLRQSEKVLNERAAEYPAMRDKIDETVSELNDTLEDYAVKLEYIRETQAAGTLGISTADDVVESANLVKIEVDEIVMRVKTFSGDVVGSVESTKYDQEQYLKSIIG